MLDRVKALLPHGRAVFLLVFLGGALVVFGAAALPPLTHHSPPGLVLPLPERSAEPAPPPETPASDADAPSRERLTGTLGQSIAAVLFAVVLLLVAGLALALRPGARSGRTDPGGEAGDVAPDAEAGAHMAAALVRAREALAAGSGPGAGSRIIACWAELEAVAAAHGRRRRPGQTPTEHAAAMLGAFGVSPAPLRRLLAAYERARYDAGPAGWVPGAAETSQAARDFATLADEVSAAPVGRRQRTLRGGQ